MNNKHILWKNWLGIILGFAVVVLPFLGFPRNIKSILFVVVGFSIIAVYFSLANDLYYLVEKFLDKKNDNLNLSSSEPNSSSQKQAN